MDDYRDIGANDFERYEKIRRRVGDLVTFFDLVTNATPGTLRIDPVQVVYDLAAAEQSIQLKPATQSFSRQVLEQTADVPDNTTTIINFPSVDGGVPFSALNGRVERLTAVYFSIDASARAAGSQSLHVSINDGQGTSLNGLPIAKYFVSAGDSTQYYLSTEEAIPTRGSIKGSVIPFSDITIGEVQGLVFEAIVGSGTGGPVTYDIRLQYEYFEP